MLDKKIINIAHDSAFKHVTGKAIYTDDIPEPKNLLHAAIGYATISKGEIIKIDYSDVIKSEGVIDIITEKDIEGINDVGPVLRSTADFHATTDSVASHGRHVSILGVVRKLVNCSTG